MESGKCRELPGAPRRHGLPSGPSLLPDPRVDTDHSPCLGKPGRGIAPQGYQEGEVAVQNSMEEEVSVHLDLMMG